jgi:hypothetical protein
LSNFNVSFSYLEPVQSIATVEGESPDDVVDKVRNYYSHAVDLEIHEVTLLEEAPKPKGPPTLRVVN